jgi:hypothetical protein
MRKAIFGISALSFVAGVVMACGGSSGSEVTGPDPDGGTTSSS